MKATSKQSPQQSNEAILREPSVWRIGLIIFIALLLVSGIVGGGLFAYRQRLAAAGNNKEVTEDLNDVTYVIGRVSRHIVLPSDEVPALLTVTDNAKLTSSFLKQAKNGDKVLVYQTNKKAILYRPGVDRIIDVGPVVIDNVQQ